MSDEIEACLFPPSRWDGKILPERHQTLRVWLWQFILTLGQSPRCDFRFPRPFGERVRVRG